MGFFPLKSFPARENPFISRVFLGCFGVFWFFRFPTPLSSSTEKRNSPFPFPLEKEKIEMKNLVALLVGSLTLSATANANLFEGVSEKTPKCFASTYSDAHLAKKSKQTVKAIHATLLSFQLEGEDTYYFLDIHAKLTHKKYKNKTFNATMSCSANGDCWIECDGGSGRISKKNGSLIFRNKGITLQGGCGGDLENEIYHFLKPVKNGDDLFSLKPAATCKTPKWFLELVETAKEQH